MSYKPKKEFFIYFGCIIVGVGTLLVVCCYRVLKKWMKEYDEHMMNNPKSKATADSDITASVLATANDAIKSTNNEECLVDISTGEDKEGGDEDRFEGTNGADKVEENQDNINNTSLRITRVNDDGSLDTKF